MKQNFLNSAFNQTIFTVLVILVMSGSIFSQNNTKNLLLNTPINQLIVKGNITVYLTQNTEQSISFELGYNAEKQIRISVKEKSLTIYKVNSLNEERVNIYISVNNLEDVKTIGDVKIETPTNISINKLSLDLSEETEANLFINSNQLDLNVSGNGFLAISGYIDTLNITGKNDSEIEGKIKSIKLSCNTSDFCNLKIEGSAFKSYLTASNNSSIDLTDCDNGKSLIVTYDKAKVKAKSIDSTDIWSFNKSSVNYLSANQATISENSKKSQIKQYSIRSFSAN